MGLRRRSRRPCKRTVPLRFQNIRVYTQDRVDYKTLLDANNLRNTCQHGRPGKWAAIVIQDEYNESPYEAYEYIYAPVCIYSCSLSVFVVDPTQRGHVTDA